MKVFTWSDRQDLGLAGAIQEYLTRNGVPVWLDRPIYPDDGDDRAYLQTLMNDSDLIIIVITSMDKSKSFRREIDVAGKCNTPVILVSLGAPANAIPTIAATRIILEKPKGREDFERIGASVLNAIREKGRKRLFISYARRDSAAVDKMRQLLAKSLHEHWIDQSNLHYGEQFPEQIVEAIKRCDMFLLCWSLNASASEWVGREWRRARSEAKLIIPVVFDSTPLPVEISKVHAFTSFEGEEFSGFFKIDRPGHKKARSTLDRLKGLFRPDI